MSGNVHSGTQVLSAFAERAKLGPCACARGRCPAGPLPRETDQQALPVFGAALVFLGPIVAVLAVAWLLASSRPGQAAAGAAAVALVAGLLAIFGRSRPSGATGIAGVCDESPRRDAGRSSP